MTQPDLRHPVYTRIVARDHHDVGAAEWIDPTTPGQVGCTLTMCGILAYEDDEYVGITCVLTDMGPDTPPNVRGVFAIPKTAIILRRDKPFILTPDHADDPRPIDLGLGPLPEGGPLSTAQYERLMGRNDQKPPADTSDPERRPRKRQKRTP